MPVYNERECIRSVLEEWYAIVKKLGNESRLLVVNDGSKDGTLEIMTSFAQTNSQCILLSKENGGHGSAVLYGYHYALKLIPEAKGFIFQTDSDGQTLPCDFWKFWALRNEADLLIGDRNPRQDGLARKILTRVLKLILKIYFGVSLADANAPYRLMNVQILKDNINLIPKDFRLPNTILPVIYARKGLRVKFLPITFRPRMSGTSSINASKILKLGVLTLKALPGIKRTLPQPSPTHLSK